MKKNLISKILILILCMAIGLAITACNKPEPSKSPDPLDKVITKEAPAIVYPDYNGGDTLVVGYNDFSSKFSPFFSKTSYDQDVALMTQLTLLTTDRQGNIIYNAIEGETVKYQGRDHTYKGPANYKVEIGTTETVYTITIRDDLFFSDGVHLTIDDVIFSMYVLSDPSYTGSATLYSQPIKGMELYRTNGIDKTAEAEAEMVLLESAVAKKAAEGTLTDNEQAAFDANLAIIQNTSAWNWVYDYDIPTLAFYYGVEEYDNDQVVYDAVALDELISCLADYRADLKSMRAIAMATEEAIKTGKVVQSISGIKKTGDYSMTVTTEGFDATTIYQLGVQASPLHYYGSRAMYKYSENKFGFTKGDLSSVKAKTTKPMGAGPYKFVKFENGTVYFERNGHYFKGCPNITNIQFKETTEEDKVPGIQTGTFDIAEPSFDGGVVTAIKTANGNAELVGNVITTNTVDFLGYGYIGICADTVKVGTDPASTASKNLRKAFATLLAVYRDYVVDSFYGERASVINYPISNTSWAAPQATDEGYKIAYSTDAEGNPIYTAEMDEEAKYAAALTAAKGFFIAAGYTWDSGTGKFTAAPAGAKLAYQIIIPGGGKGSHPSHAILTYVEKALESLGITLNIYDPARNQDLWDALEGGTAEMWCAAWGATIDPDMYQVYYSTNVVGLGGTDSNHYAIKDSTLDEKIMAARKSADQSYRKALYKECLEIIMDWGVEIPVYQRQNALIFSTARIDLDTLTPDITTFWGWMNDLEKLEMEATA